MRLYLLTVEDPLYTYLTVQPLLESPAIDLGGVTILRPRVRGARYLSTLVTLGLRRCVIAGVAQVAPRLVPTAISQVLRRRGVKQTAVHTIDDVNDPEHVKLLAAARCDVMLSLNCPQIVSEAVLGSFPRGVLNVHFGMLPRYRGIMPAYHALMNGDPSFGVTVHLMDRKIDNGPIVAQESVTIERRDTLPNLYCKGFTLAGQMLVTALQGMADGTTVCRPNDASRATYFGQPSTRSLMGYAARSLRRRWLPVPSINV